MPKIILTVPDLARCPLKKYDVYRGDCLCLALGAPCREQCQDEPRLDVSVL